MSNLVGARAFLEELTRLCPPPLEVQHHSLTLGEKGLELTIMAGSVYLPVTLDPDDLERDPVQLARDILEISASVLAKAQDK